MVQILDSNANLRFVAEQVRVATQHRGDLIRQELLRLLLRSTRQVRFAPHSFDIGGKRILLAHDLADIPDRSVESHEIVVHGHLHKQEMKERGNTLIVNPGESCGWVHGIPSGAILDLDARTVEWMSLSGPQWKF